MATIQTREGFLVIADVSGYTALFAGSELEHAQAAMQGILEVLLAQVEAPAELIKLEGDALFWRLPAAVKADRVVDHVERTYQAFRRYLFDSERGGSCSCNACGSVKTLDLKFFAHYGRYAEHQVKGATDVAGADVILVHRLMKNGVEKALGHRGYLLGTEAFFTRADARPRLQPHSESYEHLGEVRGGIYDLHEWFERQRTANPVRVDLATAHVVIRHHFDAPPMNVWDWLTDPLKRQKVEHNVDRIDVEVNGAGRMGEGSALHCMHGEGEVMMRFLDWRPFDYYTAEVSAAKLPFWQAPPPVRTTVTLKPVDGGRGTELEELIQFKDAGLLRRAMRPLYRAMSKKELGDVYATVARFLAAEPAAAP